MFDVQSAGERTRSQAAATRRLRAHFAQHNRLVLLVGILTVMVAAGLWYLLYVLLYWIAFIFATLARGMEGRPPEIFPALFIYSAGLLVLLTWLARKRSANAAPRDKKSALEIAADFLLAVPRATLAVWGNLSAWQRLSAAELRLAADFLEELEREGRIPLYNVPLHIPDHETRLRILLALQLTELLRVHRTDGVAWLLPVRNRRLLPRG